MKRAFATCFLAVIAIPICVMGYLSLCYPDSDSTESSDLPTPKLISNSVSASLLQPSAACLSLNGQALLHDALAANANDIAARTGISEEEVLGTIEGMNISTWEKTTLPTEAVSESAVSMELNGDDTTIESFECEGSQYLQITNSSESITLSIPETSANPIDELNLAA